MLKDLKIKILEFLSDWNFLNLKKYWDFQKTVLNSAEFLFSKTIDKEVYIRF